MITCLAGPQISSIFGSKHHKTFYEIPRAQFFTDVRHFVLGRHNRTFFCNHNYEGVWRERIVVKTCSLFEDPEVEVLIPAWS